jgi:hypothetical protein
LAGGIVIGTTGEHPFFARGRGWVPACELRAGDEVRLLEPGWVAVEGLESAGRHETVYNLEIEDDHTYFVGGEEWGCAVWVHNTCTPQELAQYAAMEVDKNLHPMARLAARELIGDHLREIGATRSVYLFQLYKQQVRQEALDAARSHYGDPYRREMAAQTLANLPYPKGRVLTQVDFENSAIKSMRRHYEKQAATDGTPRPGVNLDFGRPPAWWDNQILIRAYNAHLGEQILELNRLSVFHPETLTANLANYPQLTAPPSLVQYMRNQANQYMLGERPVAQYTGQQFAAAHTLDSVAGGYFWKFIGYRDHRANSTIGSRWNAGRVDQINPGQFHWGN